MALQKDSDANLNSAKIDRTGRFSSDGFTLFRRRRRIIGQGVSSRFFPIARAIPIDRCAGGIRDETRGEYRNEISHRHAIQILEHRH